MTGHLPPLNALKAFEAAARRSSFALAAAELGVTPAAISQLVRKLEQHLGKTLFTRFNNRIALTDAGQTVFAGVAPALHDIAETVQRVQRTRPQRKLVISCELSVAECWLVPSLPRFLAQHPRLRVELRAEDVAADPVLAGVDLRLSYGRLATQDAVQDELIRDAVLPLCAPAYLSGKGGSLAFTSDLATDLIHTAWGSAYGSNPTWRDWFSAFAPRQRIDMAAGHVVDASRFALQMARGGAGVALGHRWLAQTDIAEGRLVIASPHSLPLGQSYFLATPQARARRPEVLAFTAWLKDEVKALV
ncbi:MAG: LysR substrate-binding domain-containing protein [Hyphomicrobiales bacterium]